MQFAKIINSKKNYHLDFLVIETSLSVNFKLDSAHFCPFLNKCSPKMAIFSTKNRCFILYFTYLERSEPIRRTLRWSFRPICLLTLYEEKSCPYLPKWKKRSFKNWKMLFFFKNFKLFVLHDDKYWRYNFLYKKIVVHNRMKTFIYFIPFLPHMYIECVTPWLSKFKSEK